MVYLSFDLDCLDPAHALVMRGIAGLRITAADVIEYAPRFDSSPLATAFTSAILIEEIMGAMLQSEEAG